MLVSISDLFREPTRGKVMLLSCYFSVKSEASSSNNILASKLLILLIRKLEASHLMKVKAISASLLMLPTSKISVYLTLLDPTTLCCV